MNQPTTADPGPPGPIAAATPGSVFAPQPTEYAAPPPPPAAEWQPALSADKVGALAVLGRHYGIQGRLDVLGRRLIELLAGHAALVSHITETAPAAVAGTPGGTAFWGQVLDQHQIIHGMLKAAETEAAGLLAAHGAAVGALEEIL